MKDTSKTKNELILELTELRKRNKELQNNSHSIDKSKDIYKFIVETVTNALIITDSKGRIIYSNGHTEKLFGYDRQELLGKPIEILIPSRLHNIHKKYRHKFATSPGSRYMGEGRDLHAQKKDGTEFPVEVGLNPAQVDGDNVTIAIVVDITERKKAELKAEKLRKQTQLYLDVAEVIILALDDCGNVTLVNRKGSEILGYPEHEILGKNWFDNFIPAQRKKELRQVYTQLMSGNHDNFKNYENTVITKPGSERLISWYNSLLHDTEGNTIGTLSSGVDITERRQTEMLLYEREERLSQIMDNTTDAIFVFDRKSSIETLNNEATRLFLSDNNKQLRNINEIIPLESSDTFIGKLKSVRSGDRVSDFETEMMNTAGKRIPVSVSLSFVAHGGGKFIATIRDITDRVTLRNKIIDLEKSQIIGKMAEGFAHHMGTPLASMLLRVQMLMEDIPEIQECEGVMDKLHSIERQILYGQKVIQRLLKFVRRPGKEQVAVNIVHLIKESVEMIKPLTKEKGINVSINSPDIATVVGDGNLLQLVFSDTVMNAVDAMPDGGAITISVKENNNIGTLNIDIADTGIGISKDVIPFIFEPFFTTKPAGRSTGLGLSVAKRVIQDHGGEISIRSKEHEWTVVSVQIPLHPKERAI